MTTFILSAWFIIGFLSYVAYQYIQISEAEQNQKPYSITGSHMWSCLGVTLTGPVIPLFLLAMAIIVYAGILIDKFNSKPFITFNNPKKN